MKPEFECFRCIVTTRLREIENSSISKEEKLLLAKNIIQLLSSEFSYSAELTDVASKLFNLLVEKAPDIVTYYSRIKTLCNRLALENISIHVKHTENLSSRARFEYLVKLSALGNLIDYGVADHSALSPPTILPSIVEKQEYCVNQVDAFYELVKSGGKTVLWLFDNCGEAVYDLLLIREIRKMENTVWGLVKNDPGFQNDISESDARMLGLDRELDALITYGCQCSTIHLDKIGSEAKHALASADLVVAKGMSHFEYLSEVGLDKPVVFILVPKCRPVAKRVLNEHCVGKIAVLVKHT